MANHSLPKFFSHFRHRRGVALLLVISTIAILAMLVIAFLSVVRTEQRSSNSFAEGTEARTLADLPVNLVIGQIRRATESNGSTQTWASQPGMIRVYGTGKDINLRGPLQETYKLYSAADMVKVYSTNETFTPDAELTALSNWNNRPALFTDLNAPVTLADGSLTYPIMDGNDTNFSSTNSKYFYKDAAGAPLIEGFELEAAPGATTTQRCPMPVRWLYVLQDGSYATPTDSGQNEVGFSTSVPTAANPIVARVAFWADDETAKVNINTAAEGVAWDSPRGNTNTDAFGYADRQPARNEFQRYPGHPATVSLSPVLGKALGNPAINTYFNLTPRVAVGGSNGGTNIVTGDTPAVGLDNERLYATVDEYLFKADTMSASTPSTRNLNQNALDRKFFDKSKFFLTASSRAPETNLFNKPRIALWPMQLDEVNDRNALDRLIAFCSTAGTNRFYFQRASVHQLVQNGSYSSGQSPSLDYVTITRNRQLYNYLQELTSQPVPGLGGTFISKYGEKDRNQILTEIVDYMRSGLNVHAISSTGALPTKRSNYGYSFVPPRGTPGINGAVIGEGSVVPLKIGQTMGFGRHVTVTEATIIFYPTAHTQSGANQDAITAKPVVYMKETATAYSTPAPSGYGITSSEDPEGVGGRRLLGYPATKARALIMLEFFCPSTGTPTWSPYLNVEVAPSGFNLGGSSLNLSTATIKLHSPIGYIPDSGRKNVGSGHVSAFPTNFMAFFQGETSGNVNRRNIFSQDPTSGYGWHSTADVTLPVSQTPTGLSFSGGQLVISFKNYSNTEALQKVTMNFPPCTIPPIFAWAQPNGNTYKVSSYETKMQDRLNTAPSEYAGYLLRPGDVARSVEAGNAGDDKIPGNAESDASAPPAGDLRFYACKEDVPATWFVPGGRFDAGEKKLEYFSTRVRHVCGQRVGNYWQYWGHFCTQWEQPNGFEAIGGEDGDNPFHRESSFQTGGSLSLGLWSNHPYRDAAQVAARGVRFAKRFDGQAGDWDNGRGSLEDGPYINKPDDTNAAFEARAEWDGGLQGAYGGYYSRGAFNIDSKAANHAPNRQVASGITFGSLPTGINAEHPWQTLLFCANPAGRITSSSSRGLESDHPGFASGTTPPDHYLTDLFWMPVVEPYAISEPFSTGGKINMNYDIMPFRYIKRRTGMHAILKSSVAMAIKEEANRQPYGCYKGGRDQAYGQELRYDINPDHVNGTLRGFEKRFYDEKDLFRSASEICELFLVPKKRTTPFFPGGANPNYPSDAEPTFTNVKAWWDNFKGTGDNTREMPYNQIYPRLTTKSNTFTVHYRVQVLRKARSTDAGKWVEGKDLVLSEHRGSTLIERYVDPNDPALPDLATSAFNQSLDDFYRFRIVRRKQFAP